MRSSPTSRRSPRRRREPCPWPRRARSFAICPGLARTVATSSLGRTLPSRPALLASPSPGRASATSTRSHTNSARSTTSRHGYLNAILLPYVLDFYVDGAAPRMAELARACGLGRDDEDPRSLAMSLVVAIRQLNACVGIPPTLEQIADADIPEIVRRALAEAHGTYPVPAYMSAADCTKVVRRAAGRAMVEATDHRADAIGARPGKEEA